MIKQPNLLTRNGLLRGLRYMLFKLMHYELRIIRTLIQHREFDLEEYLHEEIPDSTLQTIFDIVGHAFPRILARSLTSDNEYQNAKYVIQRCIHLFLNVLHSEPITRDEIGDLFNKIKTPFREKYPLKTQQRGQRRRRRRPNINWNTFTGDVNRALGIDDDSD